MPLNNMERKEGFYWVKFFADSRWEVMEWEGYLFYKDGCRFSDKSLHQINETRILNPDEQPNTVKQIR